MAVSKAPPAPKPAASAAHRETNAHGPIKIPVPPPMPKNPPDQYLPAIPPSRIIEGEPGQITFGSPGQFLPLNTPANRAINPAAGPGFATAAVTPAVGINQPEPWYQTYPGGNIDRTNTGNRGVIGPRNPYIPGTNTPILPGVPIGIQIASRGRARGDRRPI